MLFNEKQNSLSVMLSNMGLFSNHFPGVSSRVTQTNMPYMFDSMVPRGRVQHGIHNLKQLLNKVVSMSKVMLQCHYLMLPQNKKPHINMSLGSFYQGSLLKKYLATQISIQKKRKSKQL